MCQQRRMSFCIHISKIIQFEKYFRFQGCSVITFQSERLKHQTVCEYRPVHCQYSSHGCEMVLAVKASILYTVGEGVHLAVSSVIVDGKAPDT